MSIENSDKDPDLAPEENRTPVDTAPEIERTPNEGDENQTPEKSWDDVNAEFNEAEEPKPIDPKEELEKLKAEFDEIKKERDAENKRLKDTKRSFTKGQEEIKRLKAQLAELDKPTSNKEEGNSKKDSLNEEAPTDEDIDAFAEEYGLTEEEKEAFEIQPELMTAHKKMLDKALENRIAQSEKSKLQKEIEDKENFIKQQQEQQETETWLNKVTEVHKDARTIVESEEFNNWIASNEPLRKGVLDDKAKYDPSGLIELIDHYEDHRVQIETIRQKRAYNKQASRSPESSPEKSNDDGEKSWEKINRELESRS